MRGADDVAEAVRFARERELLVSVRGGGHAVAGHAVCDGGLMIDLSLMKAISIDPEARSARAADGVLWGELDRATQRHALATTGGIISHTGIAGLTLGGGLGHLTRKHGLTVDKLRAVDLVTAEGDRMRVDADGEPDLFWGLRGGGGNFGIATSFEYDLHPVGPMVLGGPIFWPLGEGPEVLRALRDFAPDAPDELGITIVLRLAPPMPFLPADQYGKPVFGLLLVWAGDIGEGIKAVAPLAEIGTPLASVVRPSLTSRCSRCSTPVPRTATTATGSRTGSRSSPAGAARSTNALDFHRSSEAEALARRDGPSGSLFPDARSRVERATCLVARVAKRPVRPVRPRAPRGRARAPGTPSPQAAGGGWPARPALPAT